MKQGYSPRALKVSEQVQRELAQMLALEVRDPRVKGVTITQVEVTSDLSHAKVLYVHPRGFDGEKDADAGFHSVNGFLRHGIAERLSIFKAPQLRFAYDRTFEEGTRLSALIDAARTDDRRVIKDESIEVGSIDDAAADNDDTASKPGV
jgi:ribosome-binding factor A